MMIKTTMTTTQIILFCLSLGLLLLPVVRASQQDLSDSEKSYQRARQVLESGIESLGGLEAINGIRSFSLIERSTGYDVFQNPTPGPPFEEYNSVETLTVDFNRSKLRYEIDLTRPRYFWRPLTIIDGRKGYRVDRWSRTATAINAPSLNDYRHLFQKLPQFLLHEVITERAASLRWLGEGEVGGRKQEVITFIDRNNRQVALYFDAQTRLLSKWEYLYIDPAVGDTRTESIYQSYRSIDKLKVPTGVINRTGNHSVTKIQYEEIRINPILDEKMFVLPDAIEVFAPLIPPHPYTMTRIDDDLYVIENVGNSFYNVLVVVFDSFILVAEAPENRPHSGLSERVIAKIKETIPGKPIRYLVFSHHHVDHGGGTRAYIAEGATIITTPGNKRFIESVASAKFALKPDSLAQSPRQPVMEFVEGKKHTIRDANQIVEIYNVGPYWHAAEELILYLPRKKLLFEGDLFTSGFGEAVGPAQDHPVLLAEKIKQLGLDVERIIGVHGRLRPVADLYKSIEKRDRMSMK